MGKNISSYIVNLSDPSRNQLNYSSSPYNPAVLEEFKRNGNQIYMKNMIETHTDQPLRNINVILNNTIKNIK